MHCHLTGGGCLGLCVESQGQCACVLGAGAGKRPSKGIRSGDSFQERTPPKEPGDGQRVPIALAGEKSSSRILFVRDVLRKSAS